MLLKNIKLHKIIFDNQWTANWLKKFIHDIQKIYFTQYTPGLLEVQTQFKAFVSIIHRLQEISHTNRLEHIVQITGLSQTSLICCSCPFLLMIPLKISLMTSLKILLKIFLRFLWRFFWVYIRDLDVTVVRLLFSYLLWL